MPQTSSYIVLYLLVYFFLTIRYISINLHLPIYYLFIYKSTNYHNTHILSFFLSICILPFYLPINLVINNQSINHWFSYLYVQVIELRHFIYLHKSIYPLPISIYLSIHQQYLYVYLSIIMSISLSVPIYLSRLYL